MKLNGTVADLVEVHVAIQVPRAISRSVVVGGALRRFQTGILIRIRPIDVLQIDAVDPEQVDIVGVGQSLHCLFVIVVTRRHIIRSTGSRIGYAFNPNAANGVPAIGIDRQSQTRGVALGLSI